MGGPQGGAQWTRTQGEGEGPGGKQLAKTISDWPSDWCWAVLENLNILDSKPGPGRRASAQITLVTSGRKTSKLKNNKKTRPTPTARAKSVRGGGGRASRVRFAGGV